MPRGFTVTNPEKGIDSDIVTLLHQLAGSSSDEESIDVDVGR